jgi:DNA-binding transcriptional LysR family regulator
MAINELRSIATFTRAAELGSLRQAAAAQGITPQAASQALAQLEQHLGVRLFHRTTRSLALTDEGRQFLEAAQPGLDALQRAVQGARRGREDIAGPLRIAGPRSTMQHLLWPVLEEFGRRHPLVEPDVQLDDRIGNWVADRVDVGFRAGPPPAEGLIARRLFPLQLIVCAAPAYIARHGAPDSIAALAGHRCSAFRQANTGKVVPWELRVGQDIVAHTVTPALCTNDIELEAQAVLAGQVVGQLIGVTAALHIRAGRLVPLLAAHTTEHLGLYLYYGSRSAQPARVRAFIDLAIERLAGNTAYFLSEKELGVAQTKGRKSSPGSRSRTAPGL